LILQATRVTTQRIMIPVCEGSQVLLAALWGTVIGFEVMKGASPA